MADNSGSNSTGIVAIIAIVVLVGFLAFFFMRGGGKSDGNTTDVHLSMPKVGDGDAPSMPKADGGAGKEDTGASKGDSGANKGDGGGSTQ